MASKKTLAQRLFNKCRISNCRISAIQNRNVPQIHNQASFSHDPGDKAFFSRYLHRRAVPAAAPSPELRSFPTGENLIQRIKEIGISRDRIRLDGLTPPPVSAARGEVSPATERADFKKLLRVSQSEAVKSRLRESQRTWIPYPDFVRICEESCSSPEEGRSFAKTLDDSGNVVVFGDVVLLKPEQENVN